MFKKILLLAWLPLLAGNLWAQFQNAESKLSPEMINQVKEYGRYLKKFSKDRRLPKYVIAASHKPGATSDIYTLSAIFYPFQVNQFNPSSMVVIDSAAVLISDFNTDQKNHRLIQHIDSLYFKNEGQQGVNNKNNLSMPDSFLLSGGNGRKQKIPKDSVYTFDTGNSQYVDVLPRYWILEFKQGMLLKKTVSKQDVRQQ